MLLTVVHKSNQHDGMVDCIYYCHIFILYPDFYKKILKKIKVCVMSHQNIY